MPSGAEQLHLLLGQLEAPGRVHGQDELSLVANEVLELGAGWPLLDNGALHSESPNPKLIERLGHQLLKFGGGQQGELVLGVAPLREDIRLRMISVTHDLNQWLAEAPNIEKASPQRLVEILRALDFAPQVRCYRHCGEADSRVRFLVALATAIRAATDPTLLQPYMKACPEAMSLTQRLTTTYFVLPRYGDILRSWLDARIDRYNKTWQRAAERSLELFHGEVQERVVKVMLNAESGRLVLRPWPMGPCPMARALTEILHAKDAELGDLGRPTLADCPAQSLRPGPLVRLLRLLDKAVEVDESCPPGTVTLRPDTAAAAAAAAAAHSERQVLLAPPVATVPLTATTAPVAVADSAPAASAPGRLEAAPMGTAAVATSIPMTAGFATAGAAKQIPEADEKAAPAVQPQASADIAARADTFLEVASAKVATDPPADASDSAAAKPPNAAALTAGPTDTSVHGTSSAAASVPATQTGTESASSGRGAQTTPVAPKTKSSIGVPMARGGGKTPTSLGFEAPVAKAAKPTRPKLSALGFEDPSAKPTTPNSSLASSIAGVASASKLVRRKFDWNDMQFLERVVRRGLDTDEEWKVSWQQHCELEKVPPEFAVGSPPKAALVKFVERNLHELLNKKEWAKELLWKEEGQSDEMPPSPPIAPASPPIAPLSPEDDDDEDGDTLQIKPRSRVSATAEAARAGKRPSAGLVAADGVAAPAARTAGSGEQSSSDGDAEDSASKQGKTKENKDKSKKSKGSDDESSDGKNEPLVMPGHNHKTRMCYAFLEGTCYKGSECVLAHSQGELRQPGEAQRQVQEKMAKRAKREEKLKQAQAQTQQRRPEGGSKQLALTVQGSAGLSHAPLGIHAPPGGMPPPPPGMPLGPGIPMHPRRQGVPEVPEADPYYQMMMMNQMMGGFPMMMGGPMPTMMTPAMLPPQMQMVVGGPLGAMPDKKAKKKDKDEKDDKGKKRKDKDRAKDKKDKSAKEKDKGKDSTAKEPKGKRGRDDRKDEKKDGKQPKKKEAKIDAYDL